MTGRSSRLFNALRLDVTLQARYLFPQIYAVVTVIYILLFKFTDFRHSMMAFLPAFLFSEPGLLGFYFAAVQVFFERSQRTITAVAVTPLRPGEYIGALALASATIATVSGLTVYGAVAGFSELAGKGGMTALVLLAPALFLTATLHGMLGVGVAAHYTDFTHFLIGSLAVIVPLTMPLLTLFGWLPLWATVWVPSYPAVFSLKSAMARPPDIATYFALFGPLLLWNGLVFFWVRRVFERKVRSRLETF
ncbi:MAG: hypothetical protein Q8P50_03595 [Bacillota bacterium]|nr:hypothetical protein [Bacillota bacterium]